MGGREKQQQKKIKKKNGRADLQLNPFASFRFGLIFFFLNISHKLYRRETRRVDPGREDSLYALMSRSCCVWMPALENEYLKPFSLALPCLFVVSPFFRSSIPCLREYVSL